MKMKWNQGLPDKDGFYLVWNPSVDQYPTVMSFDRGGYPMWRYKTDRYVLQEVLYDFFDEVIDSCISEIVSYLGLNKKQGEKFVEFFTKKKDSFNAYDVITQSISDHCADGKTCIYDGSVRQEDGAYWSELPYLYEVNDDVEPNKDSNDPNNFDIEVEDMRAEVINRVSSAVSKTLSEQMSRFGTQVKIDAPWK